MPTKPTKGTKTITHELPADLVERLKARAESEDRKVKSVLIRALERYLATDEGIVAGKKVGKK